jgi:hypothetical protein
VQQAELESGGFFAFLADDSTFGGSESQVAQIVSAYVAELANIGLKINPQKCEVICNSGWSHPAFENFVRQGTLHNWELLGLPCGSLASAHDFVALKMAKATEKLNLVSQLGAVAPHEALALLRSSFGWSQAGFYARAVGHCPAFLDLDARLRQCLESFTTHLSDSQYNLACLPSSMGGLGLRACARHAAAAFLAAYAVAAPVAESIPELAAVRHDLVDDLYVVSVHAPCITQSVLLAYDEGVNAGVKRLSATLSNVINKEHLEALLSEVGSNSLDAARIRCLAAPGASSWLADPSGSIEGFWQTRDVFDVLFRLRFGIDILLPSTTACPFGCADAASNTSNEHLVSCMAGGSRQLAHSHLKACVHGLVGQAGSAASYETRPFPNRALRIDVQAVKPNGTLDLIDVALTNPLSGTSAGLSLGYSRGSGTAADSPAAAATAYEAVKRARYGQPTAELGPGHRLVPFVVDTFGGLGASALSYLKELAVEIARRDGDSTAVVGEILRRAVASAVARGIGQLLLAARAREEPSPRTQPAFMASDPAEAGDEDAIFCPPEEGS